VPFRSPQRRAVSPGNKSRFRGFDVLDEVNRWDDVTTGVVLARLEPDTDYSFFSPAEQGCAQALVDHLLAQWEDPRIPVLWEIDRRLAIGETDGWRYEDLPEDGQAWRQSLAALDDEAAEQCGCSFAQASRETQAEIIQGVQDAKDFRGLPAGHLWSLWTRYACAAFYSHPWAWNEIGFGGPAYPRGYKNIGVDAREHWEVRDNRNQDPVPWAARKEQAQRAHERKVTG
jgi:hypothetical protein